MAGTTCIPKPEAVDNERTTTDSNQNDITTIVSRLTETSRNSSSFASATVSKPSTAPISTTSKERFPSDSSDTELPTAFSCSSSNSKCEALEPATSPVGWTGRIPSDLKVVRITSQDGVEKMVLHAACDIAMGHTWGAFRSAGIFRRHADASPPLNEPGHNQIILQVGGGNEIMIQLSDEHSWIKLVCDASETSNLTTEANNIDVLLETTSEIINLMTTANIASGTPLRGIVRTTPTAVTMARDVSPEGSQANSPVLAGGPKRDKKCVYCGISFSSLDTLTAHMSNYCSRRPQLIGQQAATVGGALQANHSGKNDQEVPEANDPISSVTTHSGLLSRSCGQKRPFSTTLGNGTGTNLGSQSQPPPPPQRNSRHCDSPSGKLSCPGNFNPQVDIGSVLSATAALGIGTAGLGASVLPSLLNAQFSRHFGDIDLTPSGLATVAALASLGGRLQPQNNSNPAPNANLAVAQQAAQHAIPRNEYGPTTSSGSPEKVSRRLLEVPRKTVYCRGCQRFYSSSIYQSHVGISRQLNELTAADDNGESITQLAESARRLGLVLTAPLITDSGFTYIPVNAACGRQSLDNAANLDSAPSRFVQSRGETAINEELKRTPLKLIDRVVPSPLDLRVATHSLAKITPESEEVKSREEVAPPPTRNHHEYNLLSSDAPVGMLIQLLQSLLLSSSVSQSRGLQEPPGHDLMGLLNNLTGPTLAAGAQNTTTTAQWLLQSKLLAGQMASGLGTGYSAEVLETLLRAAQTNVSGGHSEAGHASAGDSPTGRSPAVESHSQPQRPYLCTNCQTRFQAYSTFKAHQQYYCQGRRKMADGSSSGPNSSSSSQTSPSAIGGAKSLANSHDGPQSPVGLSKRRRICPPSGPSPLPLSTTAIAVSGINCGGKLGTSDDGNDGSMHKVATTISSASPQSGCESDASPTHSARSNPPMQNGSSGGPTNGDWEVCGNSELRCRLCGYVGQTPRGMKMHNRLHECSVGSRSHQQPKQVVEKVASPGNKSTNSLDSSTAIVSSPVCSPQSFRTQPLC